MTSLNEEYELKRSSKTPHVKGVLRRRNRLVERRHREKKKRVRALFSGEKEGRPYCVGEVRRSEVTKGRTTN